MKKIFIGLALFIVAFVLPFAVILPLLLAAEKGIEFTGPGAKELKVEKPGKYYLWNRYYGVNDGKVHSSAEELPAGTVLTLKNVSSGEKIDFYPDSTISTSMSDSKNKSVGYFDIAQPGSYLLNISGLQEEWFFSWGPSLFDNIFSVVAGAFALVLVIIACILTALVLIILGIVDLVRKSSLRRPPPPNATA